MNAEYFPPKHKESSFHCPYCGVLAQQTWGDLLHNVGNQIGYVDKFDASRCGHCNKISHWHNGLLVIPNVKTAPSAHVDMPLSVIEDYNEAREIANLSPRGAAALLRLAIQKLMKELGEPGKDINTDIGSLVRKGLPDEIQQAFDILRVIGNESVHPGELNLKDDIETALQLFDLINFIIEDRISRKAKISSLFSRLPAGKLKGIEDRDKNKPVSP
ncbi:DUF4145 domain-containing protein [Paenibacillus sp. FSL R7-0312]|uniref:DUF4145 domain-containing protein n=1 Tax=Paenibacillus sp. FSL R7-0312 TaxID=2921682 RepID=UPI0030F943FA